MKIFARLLVMPAFVCASQSAFAALPTPVVFATSGVVACFPATDAGCANQPNVSVQQVTIGGTATPADYVWQANRSSCLTDNIRPTGSFAGQYCRLAVGAPSLTGVTAIISGGRGTTNASATNLSAYASLTAAFAAIPVGGDLQDDVNLNLSATSAPANPGVNFTGHLPSYYQPAATGSLGIVGGNRVVNLPGRDYNRFAFGQEHLTPLFLWDIAGNSSATVNIVAVGDSSLAMSTSSGAYLLARLATLPNVVVTNCGVSGTSEDMWVNALGPYATGQPNASCSMANVLATGRTIVIDMFGAADPLTTITYHTYSTDPLANALAAKQAAATAIRASESDATAPVIVEVTPTMLNNGTVTSGTSYHPDEQYEYLLDNGIRNIAIKNNTAFFDRWGPWSDAFADFIASAGQDHNLDTNRVHCQFALCQVIGDAMFRFMVPPPFDDGNIAPQLVTAFPNTYPNACFSVAVTTGSNWPFAGYVMTCAPRLPLSTTSAFQINYALNTGVPGIAFRNGQGNTWGAWTTVNNVGTATNVTPASGFNITSIPSEPMQTVYINGTCMIRGLVSQVTPAVIPSGTLIATVVDSKCNPTRPVVGFAGAGLSGSTFENIAIAINTDGTIVTKDTTVILPSRVYVTISYPNSQT